MEPSENPYATSASSIPTDAAEALYIPNRQQGLLNHVLVIGTLQIVMGILELMLGGSWMVLGVFMPFSAEMQAAEPAASGEMAATYVMFAVFAIGGGVVALFGIMRIGSGIASFYFRGRIWMLISLIGGLSSVCTCYCSVFSIGLAIYGLVVMFNPQVVAAYRMGKEGLPAHEIKRRLLYP